MHIRAELIANSSNMSSAMLVVAEMDYGQQPAKPACKLPGMISCRVSGVQLCSSKAAYMTERGTNIQSECIALTVTRCRGKNSICGKRIYYCIVVATVQRYVTAALLALTRA